MTAVVVVEAGSREENCGEREEWGWGVLLEWKNTISLALLQCLSSQLVTLKHQS